MFYRVVMDDCSPDSLLIQVNSEASTVTFDQRTIKRGGGVEPALSGNGNKPTTVRMPALLGVSAWSRHSTRI